MNKKVLILFLVPAIVTIIFVVLNFFSFFQVIETNIFDILLHVKPEIKEDPAILFIKVDEESINNVGLWPWNRDIMADGLILMKEFDANYALFDIEYLNPSPQGVDGVYLNDKIPSLFISEFDEMNEQIKNFFFALKNRQISLSDAEEYIDDLVWMNDDSKKRLLEYVAKIARDNDLYLGQTARFFGKTFFTINLPSKEEASESTFGIPEEFKQYVLEHVAVKNIEVRNPAPRSAITMKPSIYPVLSQGLGAGFPNVIIDEDGVFRRIDLLLEYNGRYFPQLIFAPLLHYLGNPDIVFYRDRIVLKNALMPGKDQKDIIIPLAGDQRLLINWSKKDFDNSFRHLSYYKLIRHKELEQDLVHNLFKVMEPAGYLNYYAGEYDLHELYLYAEQIKNDVLEGGDTENVGEYQEVRHYFFEQVNTFLHGDAEKKMLADIDMELSRNDIREEDRAFLKNLREEVSSIYKEVRNSFDSLHTIRIELQEKLSGSFCVLGWTGISTTDIGVTAFSEEYMNVGVHASIMNTILQENFLDILPWWVSVIIAIIMAVLVTIVIRNLKPLLSIITGMGFVMGITLIISLFFCFTGIYTNLLTPTLVCFFTFIIRTFIVFMETEKEKTFIRGAFSQYLSSDVVNEVISSPDKLHLGGVKKYLTALFTDIKGFSSVSEVLDPTELVKLLNAYLTEMSNIILSLKGTIDKYEGDAIISFFGAPLEFTDHAQKACLSAARMKRMERILNTHFEREKLSPNPLYTRIGINTGEMVVGNMGTEKKMDYTIMGNAVNLAARLEGVNKRYGSWILISEQTYKEGCEGIVTRKLDRVRVVGIKTPVRLYEIIDEKEVVKPEMIEAMGVFHKGLDVFEKREWKGALDIFQKVIGILGEDAPSTFFINRCKEYIKTPPSKNWDGVFNLTMK